jgi:hypothetical protein
MTNIILFPLVNQTAKQIFGVIHYIRRRIAERSFRVISKAHHPGPSNIQRKKIFEPKCVRFWIRPSGR